MSRPPAAPARPRFRVLWLAPVLALLAMLAWAYASPVGGSPDDDFHQASIWCANAARTDLCAPGSDAIHRSIAEGLTAATCFVAHPEVSGACEDDALAGHGVVDTKRWNYNGYYPPVYYAIMSVFASHDIQTSVLVMRLVNTLVFLVSAVLLWWLLPRTRRSVLLGTALVTFVPMGMFFIPSINPSSWTITGVALAWLAVRGYLESDRGWRRWSLAAVTGLCVLLAAGSRPDGAVYVVLSMGIGALLAMRRDRTFWLLAIWPAVLAIVAFFAFLATRTSDIASAGLEAGGGADYGIATRSTASVLFYDLMHIPELVLGVFGIFGLGGAWDTTMPGLVWVPGLLVFGGTLFAAFRSPTRRLAWTMTGLAAIIVIIPLWVLVAGKNLVGENVAPRYILPLIVVFGGLAVLAWQRSARLGIWQAVIIGGLVSGANLVALYTNLRRYTEGVGQGGPNLDSGAEWWWPGLPLSPMAVWVVGSLAFGACAFVLLREWRRTEGLVELSPRTTSA